MPGKLWSDKEEKHFWRVAIPQSAKRLGADLAKPEKSWVDLGKEMQQAMGNDARREYSGAIMLEHYTKNVENNRRSPNGILYVLAYLAKKNGVEPPKDIEKLYRPYPKPEPVVPRRANRGRAVKLAKRASLQNAAAAKTAIAATKEAAAAAKNANAVALTAADTAAVKKPTLTARHDAESLITAAKTLSIDTVTNRRTAAVKKEKVAVQAPVKDEQEEEEESLFVKDDSEAEDYYTYHDDRELEPCSHCGRVQNC